MDFDKTNWIFEFYTLENIYLPLYFIEKGPETTEIFCFDGISQKGRQRPQSGKDSGIFGVSGTTTYATGVTNLGTLWCETPSHRYFCAIKTTCSKFA